MGTEESGIKPERGDIYWPPGLYPDGWVGRNDEGIGGTGPYGGDRGP